MGDKVEKAKELIKNYMLDYDCDRAPSFWEMLEILEEFHISDEDFYRALDEIGEELEEEGYELEWNECRLAGDNRFIIMKYPGEQDPTEEEEEEEEEQDLIEEGEEVYISEEDFYRALDKIGEELEEEEDEGLKWWEECRRLAGDNRFTTRKYPGEQDPTEEEEQDLTEEGNDMSL